MTPRVKLLTQHDQRREHADEDEVCRSLIEKERRRREHERGYARGVNVVRPLTLRDGPRVFMMPLKRIDHAAEERRLFTPVVVHAPGKMPVPKSLVQYANPTVTSVMTVSAVENPSCPKIHNPFVANNAHDPNNTAHCARCASVETKSMRIHQLFSTHRGDLIAQHLSDGHSVDDLRIGDHAARAVVAIHHAHVHVVLVIDG